MINDIPELPDLNMSFKAKERVSLTVITKNVEGCNISRGHLKRKFSSHFGEGETRADETCGTDCFGNACGFGLAIRCLVKYNRCQKGSLIPFPVVLKRERDK